MNSVQFSSVTQSCPTLCDPMDCSTPGVPIHHQLPEFTQTHVHRVSDAAISSLVVPFSSCPQSLPASESPSCCSSVTLPFAWIKGSVAFPRGFPTGLSHVPPWCESIDLSHYKCLCMSSCACVSFSRELVK